LLGCYSIHESKTLGWSTLLLLLIAGISGTFLLRYDRRQEQPFFATDLFPPLPVAGRWSIFHPGDQFLSFVFLCTLSLFEVMHWGVRSIGFLLFSLQHRVGAGARFFLPWLFVV